MGEVTARSDMFAVCKHKDCDRVIDMSPQRTLPNGKRPAPKQVRGMCMKCTMAAYRADSKNRRHTVVCAECGQTKKVFHQTAIFCGSKCQRINAGKLGNQANISKAEERQDNFVYIDRPCKFPDCSNLVPGNSKKKYCSSGCRSIAHKERSLLSRSPLRKAVEDWDYEGMVDALKAKVSIDGEFGCWLWPKLNRKGYPEDNWAHSLHRRVCEVTYGKPLGEQKAHHKCETPACVRPEHLQPVTHAQNMAEMLARWSYKDRIAELEAVIATELRSDHPVLDRIELR